MVFCLTVTSQKAFLEAENAPSLFVAVALSQLWVENVQSSLLGAALQWGGGCAPA